jgi:hypothetical protein
VPARLEPPAEEGRSFILEAPAECQPIIRTQRLLRRPRLAVRKNCFDAAGGYFSAALGGTRQRI